MAKKYILKQTLPTNKKLPSSFDETLNTAQKEAVYFNNGPLLVIAGAGSGKTKTLVYRVARLVHDGINPESILLLTFTRKSSQEMLKRASTVLDQRCQRVSGGTFHSFANQILREFGTHIGYETHFTILDRSDSEDLISSVRKELAINNSDKRFPKKQTIASMISKSINTDTPLHNIIYEEYPQFIEFSQMISTIRDQYHSQKKQMQVLDYDDLLVKLCELLTTCPDIKDLLAKRYAYIMVDEYQDTNAIQNDIICNLVGPDHNIMVVGDDSQSIYSFRGADFKNIMSFPSLFSGTTTITLEENYRSSQPILDLTNEVISHAKERYSKSLFTQNENGDKPIFIETENDNTQSRFICQKILELREEGVELKDIAILIRSGWHSNDLEVELQSRDIPFVKVGGFKFIEAAHVKDILCYLKVIFNPADSLSWRRILVLTEGLGQKGAADLISHITTQYKKKIPITLTPFKKKKYMSDVEKLIKLILNPHNRTKTPTQLLDVILSYYTPLFKQHYDDYTKRESDLNSLKTISERYTKIDEFLTEMALEPPESSETKEKNKDDEYITISTIHSAKGLEWDTVFLLSAVDGYLPSFQSLGDLKQIEEERRLLYVALTRAKQKLFILKPNLEASSGRFYQYTGIQFSKVSRFLDTPTILESYLEHWSLAEETPPHDHSFAYKQQKSSHIEDDLSYSDLPPQSHKKYFF